VFLRRPKQLGDVRRKPLVLNDVAASVKVLSDEEGENVH
jgi:hypothetical protein